MPSSVVSRFSARASAAEVETFASAMVSKACFIVSTSSVEMPTREASPRRESPHRVAFKRKLLGAATAGDEANAGFHQAHVKLRMRLPPRSVK